MPSVSSDDAGLEDRDEDFFEVSEKESEKFSGLVPEVRNVCSVPKVASGSNLASVRVFLSFDFFSPPGVNPILQNCAVNISDFGCKSWNN